MPEADEPCVPDAAWAISRWAALRVATHTALHQSFRMKPVCACRQDIRVGGIRKTFLGEWP